MKTSFRVTNRLGVVMLISAVWAYPAVVAAQVPSEPPVANANNQVILIDFHDAAANPTPAAHLGWNRFTETQVNTSVTSIPRLVDSLGAATNVAIALAEAGGDLGNLHSRKVENYAGDEDGSPYPAHAGGDAYIAGENGFWRWEITGLPSDRDIHLSILAVRKTTKSNKIGVFTITGLDAAGMPMGGPAPFSIDAEDTDPATAGRQSTTVTTTVAAADHEGNISLTVAAEQVGLTRQGYINALQITYDRQPPSGIMNFDFGTVDRQTTLGGWNNFHKGDDSNAACVASAGCATWKGKGGWVENAVDSEGNVTAVNLRIVDSNFSGSTQADGREYNLPQFPPTATVDGFRVKKPSGTQTPNFARLIVEDLDKDKKYRFTFYASKIGAANAKWVTTYEIESDGATTAAATLDPKGNNDLNGPPPSAVIDNVSPTYGAISIKVQTSAANGERYALISALKVEQVDVSGVHTPFPTPEQMRDLAESFPPIPEFDRPGYPGNWPTQDWVVGNPGDHGFSDINLVVNEVFGVQAATEPTALLIVKNGYLVHEQYEPANGGGAGVRAQIASASKSLVSIAMGHAMYSNQAIPADERPVFEKKVGDYFPAILSKTNGADLTIEMMMSMASGLKGVSANTAMSAPEGAVEYVLNNAPLKYLPGSRYLYHTQNVWLCSRIVELVSPVQGDTLETYLNRKIMEPIGAEDVLWAGNSDGNAPPTSLGHAQIYPRDLARLGFLMLNRGKWRDANGEYQLLSTAYVDRVSRSYGQFGSYDESFPGRTAMGGNSMYQGFWWRPFANATNRHNVYYAHGAGGNLLYIFPGLDMVVVRLGKEGSSGLGRDERNNLLYRIMEALGTTTPL